MFLSYYNLKNNLEKYKNMKLENHKIENYKNEEKQKESNLEKKCNSFDKGFSRAFDTFTLVISVIFFIFELILLYFAVFIAINCSTSTEEKIINFVLAITFTIPYVFFSILFNPCAKNYIRAGMK